MWIQTGGCKSMTKFQQYMGSGWKEGRVVGLEVLFKSIHVNSAPYHLTPLNATPQVPHYLCTFTCVWVPPPSPLYSLSYNIYTCLHFSKLSSEGLTCNLIHPIFCAFLSCVVCCEQPRFGCTLFLWPWHCLFLKVQLHTRYCYINQKNNLLFSDHMHLCFGDCI